jgi:hypothetical protein
MLLLPFGRDEGSDKLRIEITPAKVEANNLSADMAQTPVINISKPAPGGLISIQAFKVPHRFEVETMLLENGREVARGESVYLLEDEKKELALRPDISSSPAVAKNPLVLKLSVDNYASLQPTAQVGISFDVLRGSSLATAQAQEIALGWAGTALLGREFTYDLGEIYHPQADSKYQLRFKIRVAEAEASNK